MLLDGEVPATAGLKVKRSGDTFLTNVVENNRDEFFGILRKVLGEDTTESSLPANVNLGETIGFFLLSKSSIFSVKSWISTQMVLVTSDH